MTYTRRFLHQLYLNNPLHRQNRVKHIKNHMMPTALDQRIGCRMPDLTLPSLDGKEHVLQSLIAAYKGVVVIFWSGLCSHCRRYDAYLNQFPERRHDVALVVIASRRGETLQELLTIVADRSLRFPILYDAEQTVAHTWLVQQTPRAFLLDAQRQLLYRGAIDNFKYPQDPDYEAYLDLAIDAFLADQPLPRIETPSFGCPIESIYYSMSRP